MLVCYYGPMLIYVKRWQIVFVTNVCNSVDKGFRKGAYRNLGTDTQRKFS